MSAAMPSPTAAMAPQRSRFVQKFDIRFFKDVWKLSLPYWRSEERWSARVLLVAIIALNLGQVYLNVLFNSWSNTFYNALQEYDAALFWHQMFVFTWLAISFIAAAVASLYLNQWLQIRWRRWLTSRYIDRWMANRVYYRMQLTQEDTDNPDQRISEDLRDFTSNTLSLGLDLLSSIVTLLSFLTILWELSGPLTIPLGGLGSITVPGYMLWAALLYAVVGTWLTNRVGRPLIALDIDQQRFEADFRFNLVRVRENTESIAFYQGETQEKAGLFGRFNYVYHNFKAIMGRRKWLTSLTTGYSQVAVIFPFLVAAPRYFAKEIPLGGLMQISSAFGQVQSSLSYVVSSYTQLATWRAVTARLVTFSQHMAEIEARQAAVSPIDRTVATDGGVTVETLDLNRPDGTPIRQKLALAVARGGRLLIMGPSGSGRSTLLRAVSGLWPFARGRVAVGAGKTLFLPQRPYLPLGGFGDVLLYPGAPPNLTPDRIEEVLAAVGLEAYRHRLEEVDQWSQRLSLGEQQRLGFARILLQQPDIVFLDEATSALDEASEVALYRLIETLPRRPTVVSVGHRSTLRALHDQVVDLTQASGGGAPLAGMPAGA